MIDNMIPENANDFNNKRWQLIETAFRDNNLSMAARVLYARLAIKYVNENGLCWPGEARLASDLSITVQWTRDLLKELTTENYITKTRRRRNTAILKIIQDRKNISGQEILDRNNHTGQEILDRNNHTFLIETYVSKNMPSTRTDSTAERQPNQPMNQPYNNNKLLSEEARKKCASEVFKNKGKRPQGKTKKLPSSPNDRISKFFKYVQEKSDSIIIDYAKHGKLLKQRITFLDKTRGQENTLPLLKILFTAYLILDEWPVSVNGYNLTDFLNDKVFSKLLQGVQEEKDNNNQQYSKSFENVLRIVRGGKE